MEGKKREETVQKSLKKHDKKSWEFKRFISFRREREKMLHVILSERISPRLSPVILDF